MPSELDTLYDAAVAMSDGTRMDNPTRTLHPCPKDILLNHYLLLTGLPEPYRSLQQAQPSKLNHVESCV